MLCAPYRGDVCVGGPNPLIGSRPYPRLYDPFRVSILNGKQKACSPSRLCCQTPLTQEAVPNAVIAAVMMLAINWRIALHVSFFIFVIV